MEKLNIEANEFKIPKLSRYIETVVVNRNIKQLIKILGNDKIKTESRQDNDTVKTPAITKPVMTGKW